jgi:hypothetical protein
MNPQRRACRRVIALLSPYPVASPVPQQLQRQVAHLLSSARLTPAPTPAAITQAAELRLAELRWDEGR